MASLLARMNMTPGTAGPVRRTKSASQRPTPYVCPYATLVFWPENPDIPVSGSLGAHCSQ